MAQETTILSTRRTGPSISDRVHFRASFTEEPTHSDIFEAQVKAGYHPNGYDGPWVVSKEEKEGHWLAQWSCSASCD